VNRVAVRPNWKNAGLLVFKLAISAVMMVFLFSRIPLESLVTTLRHANRLVLVLAWLMLLGSNLLASFQWERLLQAVDIRIPFWKVCAYYHVGLFFNNFLPAGIGMDVARVMDASRYGPNRAAAVSTVVMDRIIGTVALAGLALVTTLPAIDRFHLSLIYGALVVFFASSVLLLWAVFHPGLLPAIERLLARFGLGGLKPHLDELAARFQHFRGRRRLLAGLFVVAVLVQLSRIAVHVLVARALGIGTPLTYFFLFVPLLAVIVSLPISLNGIGVREGAGIILFGLVGVQRAPAFSLQFTTYLVGVAVSLIGMLIFLGRMPRRRAEARDLRRTT
jgi:glycosyltransferase 2 family protein